MENVLILDEFEDEKSLQIASIGTRFGALVIDTIVLVIIDIAVFAGIYFWLTITGLGGIPEIIENIITLVISTCYFGFQEGNSGATIGKRAVGIKVVSTVEEPMSLGRGFTRALSRILSGLILLIGYIMAFFNDKKQTLHDNIAKTVVVRA